MLSSLVLMVDYREKWCRFYCKGICEPKTNNWGNVFDFVCNSIVPQRRVVKSINVIKIRSIKAISLRDFIENS